MHWGLDHVPAGCAILFLTTFRVDDGTPIDDASCSRQDILDSFSTNQRTLEEQLLGVLRTSYDLLPSDQHRLMFLDAALMLRGRPAAHLVATWEGMLLLDPPKTSLLPLRSEREGHAAWQSRRSRAAGKAARMLLDDLHRLSLINFEINSGVWPIDLKR